MPHNRPQMRKGALVELGRGQGSRDERKPASGQRWAKGNKAMTDEIDCVLLLYTQGKDTIEYIIGPFTSSDHANLWAKHELGDKWEWAIRMLVSPQPWEDIVNTKAED